MKISNGGSDNITSQVVEVGGNIVSFGPIPYNARVELFKSHERKLVPYDATMHSERAVYFPGDYRNEYRILTHFYTYLYFAEPHAVGTL
jgi:hypothetical protein